MKCVNPFVIKGYRGPEYFCDRQEETRRLVSAIENGRDVTLMAPRRYGKTGLVQHVFGQLDGGYRTLYLDIFNVRDLSQFVRMFASAVTENFSTPMEKTGRGLLNFFRGIRPTMIPQEDGFPKFSFDVIPAQAEGTLKDVFAFLKSRTFEMVIAIDEFQQVREFPEPGVEALLRSHIQFCTNVHFIFSGSKQHVMQEMFATSRGPFYQSTQLMSLGTIGREAYCDFAARFFRSAKKPFDEKVFGGLYSRFDGVTWYLQAVLNRVWNRPEGLSSAAVVEEAAEELVAEGEMVFHDLLTSQTAAAQKVLWAIAREGVMEKVSSKEMLVKYDLPTGSTVRSVVADLAMRDILLKTDQGYRVYDRLFSEWLARQMA